MKYNLSDNLKQLRLAKNYTQEQAATLLNISPKSLSRWECGSSLPDIMMLPELAKLYGVTVDDLYREKSNAYENYALRLVSVYEASRDINDFINAEREFSNLLKSQEYTLNDVRSYAILYQYLMLDCKDTALSLFQKALNMDKNEDPDTYHQIERQRILMLSQIGENKCNIEEQSENLSKHPKDFYSHINLLMAYFYAGDTGKALDIFLAAEKDFSNHALLYAYGGDIYKRLQIWEQAFECWNRALLLDPETTSPMWAKAMCYEELEKFQKAYDAWLEIIHWLEDRGYEEELREPRMRAKVCKGRISKN